MSQAGQDFWIFGEAFNGMMNGYFVDIGAADGITLSNTFLLETRYKWRGVCIEADLGLFNDLKLTRRVQCVNACLDFTTHEIVFAPAGLLGGIVDADTDNKDPDSHVTTVYMTTRSLVSILEEQHAPSVIDYLSLDVEGAEERVLSRFPFEDYLFKCMTIERPTDPLRRVLDRSGYVLIKEIPHLDAFYVHKSFLADYRRNLFSFWHNYRF